MVVGWLWVVWQDVGWAWLGLQVLGGLAVLTMVLLTVLVLVDRKWGWS